MKIGRVSAALGHASVQTTWKTYHHLMPGTMDQAGDQIQIYLDAARSPELLSAPHVLHLTASGESRVRRRWAEVVACLDLDQPQLREAEQLVTLGRRWPGLELPCQPPQLHHSLVLWVCHRP